MLSKAYNTNPRAFDAFVRYTTVMMKEAGKGKKKKNPIAVALVALRNKKLSPERRKEIARKAALARWGSPVEGPKKKP